MKSKSAELAAFFRDVRSGGGSAAEGRASDQAVGTPEWEKEVRKVFDQAARNLSAIFERVQLQADVRRAASTPNGQLVLERLKASGHPAAKYVGDLLGASAPMRTPEEMKVIERLKANGTPAAKYVADLIDKGPVQG